MSRPKHVRINGQTLVWKAVVAAYREQAKAAATPEQPALFEMRLDAKPEPERSAASRYMEPTLFELLVK